MFLHVLRLSQLYDITVPDEYTFTIEYKGLRRGPLKHFRAECSITVVVHSPDLKTDTEEIARIVKETNATIRKTDPSSDNSQKR